MDMQLPALAENGAHLCVRIQQGPGAFIFTHRTLRATGAPADYTSSTAPWLRLLEQLSQRKDRARVFIQRSGLRLRMERTK